MDGRLYDAEGNDVTESRPNVVSAGARRGEKHKGDWMQLTPVEAELIRKFRARLAERETSGYKK